MSSKRISITSASAVPDTGAPNSYTGPQRMSSHRPLGPSKILALWSFYLSICTTNWARTTSGQLFVTRFVAFSSFSKHRDLLTGICSKVVKLLDERDIQLTSADLARFRWEEQKADGGSEIVTTRITIWVLVGRSRAGQSHRRRRIRIL